MSNASIKCPGRHFIAPWCNAGGVSAVLILSTPPSSTGGPFPFVLEAFRVGGSNPPNQKVYEPSPAIYPTNRAVPAHFAQK